MTASQVAAQRVTGELRALSKAVFGRWYEIEVAAAAASLEKNSTVEEIFLKAMGHLSQSSQLSAHSSQLSAES
jgi:hypothetical protein